jgi:lipopolysaccharide/colanic/teichoic acid biosynthesis glycosyltransferase
LEIIAFVKRAIDLFVSCVVIFPCAPLFAFLIVLVMLDGGPAFYAQRRVGRGGRAFWCLKFRTMVENADEVLERYLSENAGMRKEYETFWKLKKDPRVTWIGNFLRRYSLDELPQVFNVIKGDMSLVGPRPRSVSEIEFFDKLTPEYNRTYRSVKPGLTGLWQVSGRNRLSLMQKGDLDARYAEHWSIRLDMAILFATISVVLSGDGAF